MLINEKIIIIINKLLHFLVIFDFFDILNKNNEKITILRKNN